MRHGWSNLLRDYSSLVVDGNGRGLNTKSAANFRAALIQ
jgi:hypothetical protein